MSRPTTEGALDDIVQRILALPTIDDFPGVDELIASLEKLRTDHPELVRVSRIGTSRLGEPIHMYAIGEGSRSHLLFAGVHPNEPIGFRTIEQLASLVCTDAELRARLDATWYVIGCIDPDGTRLNEGWFADPGSRTHYARHFYRPAPTEQVEWTFPFSHKDAWFDAVMPETQALMRAIDEVRPELMVSLHNAELGGVYYYVTPVPGVVEPLHAIPRALGLPLDVGEPETQAAEVLGPAVYAALTMGAEYDYLESIGIDPTEVLDAGDSSASYADRYGTVTLVAELPYWSHPDAEDVTASDLSYADVLRIKADALAETSRVLREAFEGASLSIDTPFRRATEAFVPSFSRLAERERDRAERAESDRPATRAEVFTNADLVRCFRLRYGGMAVRALEAEQQAGIATPGCRRRLIRLREIFETWCEEADSDGAVTSIDINRLVGVQLGATLALADHLRRTA